MHTVAKSGAEVSPFALQRVTPTALFTFTALLGGPVSLHLCLFSGPFREPHLVRASRWRGQAHVCFSHCNSWAVELPQGARGTFAAAMKGTRWRRVPWVSLSCLSLCLLPHVVPGHATPLPVTSASSASTVSSGSPLKTETSGMTTPSVKTDGGKGRVTSLPQTTSQTTTATSTSPMTSQTTTSATNATATSTTPTTSQTATATSTSTSPPPTTSQTATATSTHPTTSQTATS
ncbi:PREDICTED: cell wall protein DAN4-like, partial [Rhinopithecus bieti]|uniref:cell wall protein DAN4-like n=1 Tax=Rhinopithecus bieti TaxID=61621 RepID=UPI00083C827D